jgi:prepilin-type N-terminal cleavage/methylation domain-containing protein
MKVQRGFTVIEILIAIAIFAIIIALPSMLLYGTSRTDNLNFAYKQVKNSIGEAQVLTVASRSTDGQNPAQYGIYITTNSYVLFSGSAYNPNSATNEVTTLPSGVQFTTIQIPNSTILFERVTGKISNYSSTQHTLVLTETNTQQTKTLTLSTLGVQD